MLATLTVGLVLVGTTLLIGVPIGLAMLTLVWLFLGRLWVP